MLPHSSCASIGGNSSGRFRCSCGSWCSCGGSKRSSCSCLPSCLLSCMQFFNVVLHKVLHFIPSENSLLCLNVGVHSLIVELTLTNIPVSIAILKILLQVCRPVCGKRPC